MIAGLMRWLRRIVTQLALSRSDAALIKQAGGAPRQVRGFTLEPRVQAVEAMARKRRLPEDLSPEFLREQEARLVDLFGGRRVAGVTHQQIYVPGRSHSVPGRLYLPRVRDNSAPVLVYFHAGGGVVGSLESCHRLCALIAKESGAPVLSVEYRLAPEYRWPAGLEDAQAAYLWAVEQAARYGAPHSKAAVGGDSMGANFAAIIAQAGAAGEMPTPEMQLLIYPAVDAASTAPSMRDFADAFPATEDVMRCFLVHYLPDGADAADPHISPAYSADLAGLPRALIYTAGFDMLLDQGEAYADRLEAARVKVARHCFTSLPHGFVAFPAICPAADAACRRIAREAAAVLKGNA